MSYIASALAMQLGETGRWHAPQTAVRSNLVVTCLIFTSRRLVGERLSDLTGVNIPCLARQAARLLFRPN